MNIFNQSLRNELLVLGLIKSLVDELWIISTNNGHMLVTLSILTSFIVIYARLVKILLHVLPGDALYFQEKYESNAVVSSLEKKKV